MDMRALSRPNLESASMQASEMNFGLNMLRQTPATEPMVISPVSVIFALAMVQLGARGRTKIQIDRVIADGATDDTIVSFYSDLFKNISDSRGAQARIANGFLVNKTFPIKEDYSSVIAKKYGAAIKAYDFRQSAKTAELIDNFVSEKTDGKIKNLITSSVVKANEEKIKFLKEIAKNRLYAETEVVQVLSLPYKNTSYSFNIFLPKKRFGLEELRLKLDGSMIQSLLSRLKSTLLTISIPKMKLEKSYNLKKALEAMGVTDLFDSDSANLSGISEVGLYASDAKHRAFIEVQGSDSDAHCLNTVHEKCQWNATLNICPSRQL